MTPLNKGNSVIDPHSGAILFKGTPEFRAICELQTKVAGISQKLDTIIELLSKEGTGYGRQVESPGQCEDNDPEI